jgi:hypothetical protein
MRKSKKFALPPPAKPNTLAKSRTVEVMLPDSPAQALEDLLIFDARCLDEDTRRELLRIVPALIHVRRAWKARFAELGCVSCKRRDVPCGPGSYCESCYARERLRLINWYKDGPAKRDTDGELATITSKYDAAQLLLNGDED